MPYSSSGLERTRKAVRDTGRNVERMEVAHRLGQQAHRVVKERDPYTGRLLENRELEYIDNENEFEREWNTRADRAGLRTVTNNGFYTDHRRLAVVPPWHGRPRSQSQGPRHLAIEQPHDYSHSSRKTLQQRI
jgi:hypothetical protein